MMKSLSFALVLVAGGLSALAPARAQMTESELVTRLNRLENQVRQLTGEVERLQYRNQQLEQQLRGAQPAPASAPARSAAPQPQYTPPPAYPQQQAYPQAAPPQASQRPSAMEVEPYSQPPAPAGGRRGDAFDPNMSPNAPGAPRTLGNPGTIAAAPPLDNTQSDEPPYVGAPGGREAGAPLDLGTMSEEAAYPPPRGPVRQIPGALPAPPPRNPSGTGAQQMVMAPTNTPKDEYDLAYGYLLRKDYALAEEGLRAFVKKYPNDRLVADANYWLGESLFQRQRYREAAESFLAVSTKFQTAGKAPDSLLRLGQSLAALKEKEAACATLGELPRKYPKAPANVKQAAEKEQKRVGCV
ncbi:MAG: tol-pal system protein YbgF [Alphaproteobacteria bacterium]